MNVRLTPELQTLVQTKVKAGLYPSADDLVCEAVRLLERRDRAGRRRVREIRAQIDEGWSSSGTAKAWTARSSFSRWSGVKR